MLNSVQARLLPRKSTETWYGEIYFIVYTVYKLIQEGNDPFDVPLDLETILAEETWWGLI